MILVLFRVVMTVTFTEGSWDDGGRVKGVSKPYIHKARAGGGNSCTYVSPQGHGSRHNIRISHHGYGIPDTNKLNLPHV